MQQIRPGGGRVRMVDLVGARCQDCASPCDVLLVAFFLCSSSLLNFTSPALLQAAPKTVEWKAPR
eukprot:3986018-Pleurochrysis_carterae.AAC.1